MALLFSKKSFLDIEMKFNLYCKKQNFLTIDVKSFSLQSIISFNLEKKTFQNLLQIIKLANKEKQRFERQ